LFIGISVEICCKTECVRERGEEEEEEEILLAC
jgi:hypothetical protein